MTPRTSIDRLLSIIGILESPVKFSDFPRVENGGLHRPARWEPISARDVNRALLKHYQPTTDPVEALETDGITSGDK